MSVYGHILHGPTVELRREEEEPRWCFGCRKRLPGTYILLDYAEDSPHYGYYEPVTVYRCYGCDQDQRWGFGW